MPRPGPAADPRGWRGGRSFHYLRLIATAHGPFLHAGEVVVAAIAALPHGQDQRQIRLLLVLESRHDRLELGERALGVEVGVAFLEVDHLVLAGGLAALERDIDQLGNAGPRGNVGKSTATQDRGFERELRRDADAHLLLARYLSGLVVEDGIAAVGEALDAVGAGAQREHATVQWDLELAVSLGGERRDVATPRPFPAGKPASDALEARPPERARLGIVLERGEMPPSDLDHRCGRIGGQAGGEGLGEFTQ